jgi:hypothetical protein
MKRIQISILFVVFFNFGYGQKDTLYLDPIKVNTYPKYRSPENDLIEDWFWSNYLISFGKKSLLSDTTIKEAIRLIYWGNYLSVIEIIKSDSIFQVEVDSLSWINNHIVYRNKKIISKKSEIVLIQKICKELFDSIGEVFPNQIKTIHNDDRDIWVLECKLENEYITSDKKEMGEDMKRIIGTIMRFGELSGCRIYNKSGGFEDY